MDNNFIIFGDGFIGDGFIFQPKYVAFDIGNVLCHVDLSIFQNYLVEIGLFENKEKSFNFIASIQASQDLGMCDIKQEFGRFFPKLSEQELKNIKNVWLDVLSPSNEMFTLIDDLYIKGYTIALLSNIGIDHAKKVRQEYPALNRCYHHFSCEVGARKPTSLFYQSFMFKNQNWLYSSCANFFFDDRKENIDGANGYFSPVLFDLTKFQNDNAAAVFIRNKLNLK